MESSIILFIILLINIVFSIISFWRTPVPKKLSLEALKKQTITNSKELLENRVKILETEFSQSYFNNDENQDQINKISERMNEFLDNIMKKEEQEEPHEALIAKQKANKTQAFMLMNKIYHYFKNKYRNNKKKTNYLNIMAVATRKIDMNIEAQIFDKIKMKEQDRLKNQVFDNIDVYKEFKR